MLGRSTLFHLWSLCRNRPDSRRDYDSGNSSGSYRVAGVEIDLIHEGITTYLRMLLLSLVLLVEIDLIHEGIVARLLSR